MFQEEGLGAKPAKSGHNHTCRKSLSAKPDATILTGHLKLVILETISAKRYWITANRPAGVASAHWTQEVGQASFAKGLKDCISSGQQQRLPPLSCCALLLGASFAYPNRGR